MDDNPRLARVAVNPLLQAERLHEGPGNDKRAVMRVRFASTTELAEAAGVCRVSAWRACRANPGFALRLGGSYRIPAEHIERVKRGETPAQIAADVRARGGRIAH